MGNAAQGGIIPYKGNFSHNGPYAEEGRADFNRLGNKKQGTRNANEGLDQ